MITAGLWVLKDDSIRMSLEESVTSISIDEDDPRRGLAGLHEVEALDCAAVDEGLDEGEITAGGEVAEDDLADAGGRAVARWWGAPGGEMLEVLAVFDVRLVGALLVVLECCGAGVDLGVRWSLGFQASDFAGQGCVSCVRFAILHAGREVG
jgi:hypothetical protein